MPSLYTDSFTDTNGTLLENHTPDSPTAFSYTQFDANQMTIQDGRVGNDVVATPTICRYTADADPLDPNDNIEKVEVVINVNESGSVAACSGCGGVIYFLDDAVNFDGYGLVWSGNSMTEWILQIVRATGGSHSSLWNSGAIARPSTGTHTLRLERDASGDLIAYLDDVAQNVAVNDTTHGVSTHIALGCKSNSSNDLAILSMELGEDATGPTAEFSYQKTDEDSVDFTDESVAGDSAIASWDWDFGDGSPHGTSQNPSHDYAAPGTYTVTLTVEDGNNLTDQVQHDVRIFDAIPADDPQAASYLPILHVDSFESTYGQEIGLRMKARQWERYNGQEWRVISTVPGQRKQRLYVTTIMGKVVAANGFSRLLSWDGHPNNAVEELSSEAPRAYYVTRIGNRLFAAKIRSSQTILDFNPDEVAYSADGDITEWTNSLAGAGRLIVAPEGKSPGTNYISGLSTLERGAVLYRQRSLVLVSRTGVRAAPFRFQTVDFSHGTESPYSIANGGLALGDFFLGYDYIVYHFDGASPPVPVGLPIQRRLEERVTHLDDCVGFIDPLAMEYWLLVPTQENNQPVLDEAYVFSIRDYIRKQKLAWRVCDLSLFGTDTDTVTAGGYPQRVPTNYVPVVDEYDDPVNDIVDDNTDLVDALIQETSGMVMLGTSEGDTYQYDKTKLQMDGYWLSKQFGRDHELITVDRVRLVATASEVCYVGVSVTWDGGQTYSNEIPVRIEPSNQGSFMASGWGITSGHLFQVRLRMINGDCTVHKINVLAQPRGRAA